MDRITRTRAWRSSSWLLLAFCALGANPFSERNHETVFTRENLLKADGSALQSTLVTPHLDAPVAPGTNVLWCGTFQLAWNEACALLGEDIAFATPSETAAKLNLKRFTAACLDRESHVAMAGFVKDNIHRRIDEALRMKFRGAARPRLLPPGELTPRPDDLVAYSYLFKNLEFETPFERLEEPLVFGGLKVPAFGFGRFKPEHSRLYPQVAVHDYRGPNDFAVELKSKATGDRIVLAKLSPGPTLLETTKNTLARLRAAPARAEKGDLLIVPKFNFDLTARYTELERRRLALARTAAEYYIVSALQNTRLQMDERGVKLRSESQVSIACSAPERPEPKHIMIFDKPFLLLLMRNNAEMPYFVLWVDNPELLVREGN